MITSGLQKPHALTRYPYSWKWNYELTTKTVVHAKTTEQAVCVAPPTVSLQANHYISALSY